MIGERLARLRRERGWTRNEVAIRLGVLTYDVGAIESARTTGARRLQMYLRYADLLGIECHILVGAPPRDGDREGAGTGARASEAEVRRRRPMMSSAGTDWMGLHPNTLMLLMMLLRAQAWETLLLAWRATRVLQAEGSRVTQAAVSRMLDIETTTLRFAPGVRALLTLTTNRVGRRYVRSASGDRT